ncbi:MAG: LytTR family transcriptional regulator [Flavobacteriales bacterium]|nr:LytTR family transcriptional regulator [Flavobacteriales bacterium]NQX97045.1 LytTR family transcriptional regulator [Flavobacteriales bacterium]
MQINVKEHTKESLLKQKLKQLEKKLLTTQKELQRESEYNTHLESIIKGDSVKKSTTITIKSATKIEFVPVNDIICCNADEGYTDVLLIDGRIITAAKPLTIFENILEPHSFFRVNKSHIINTNHIITFHKDRNQILLYGNILLDISRRRRVEFLKNL